MIMLYVLSLAPGVFSVGGTGYSLGGKKTPSKARPVSVACF
jgi:hypothetical protein